jgi:quercetin 2,3-dioxygenase
MMTVRRAHERHHGRRRKQEVWSTFHPKDQADALAGGFGTLEILNEERIPPGAAVASFRPDDIDVVTYVREGGLAYEDSTGHSGVIHAGEFRRMSTGRGIRHSEANASRTDWAQVFQVRFRASDMRLEPSHEQKRFSAAERRGLLCAVASPDARGASLLVHQDAVMYSTILPPGQHMVHELSQGRCAWLHVVQGELTISDVVLTTGDGAGFNAEPSVSVTAQGETELLLFDLGQRPPARPTNGRVPRVSFRDL